PLAAWEVSRKIRAPENETSYQTYSRVLGWRSAALLPALFASGSAVSLLFVARAARLGILFPILIVAASGIVIFRCALFRLAPSRSRADLKPWAVLFAVFANAGLAAA